MLDTPNPQIMQRANGQVRLGFCAQRAGNGLSELYQSGCLKLMMPRTNNSLPDAVLINTAGGLTGGDQLHANVSIGDKMSARLSTQTAERIYKSHSGTARVQLEFDLGAGARFDWLAQETILFNGGQVERRITAHLQHDASLLMVEPIVLGRLAMGEQVEQGFIHDHWRVHRDGVLIFADNTRLDDFAKLHASAALGDANALVTMLFVDPRAEALCAQIKTVLAGTDLTAGASAWNGMMLIRALGPDPQKLRQTILKVMSHLRTETAPRVWTM